MYQLSSEGAVDEAADDEEDIVAYHLWTMPAVDFEGLWESLYMSVNIKDRLLNYAASAMLFSDAKVNPHIISCNRVVLLHGPPGNPPLYNSNNSSYPNDSGVGNSHSLV